MPTHRLQSQHTALLAIDIQVKLLPHMHNAAQVVSQAGLLIDGFKALALPILMTEQYRKGLGATVPEIAEKLAQPTQAPTTSGGGEVETFEKLKFSACIEPVRETLQRRGIRSIVICGIEAHVCVLQSCLDLIDHGYTTAVALDAIGSRRAEDQQAAVMRMVQAGIVPTTAESALLELVHEAGGPAFKSILPLIK